MRSAAVGLSLTGTGAGGSGGGGCTTSGTVQVERSSGGGGTTGTSGVGVHPSTSSSITPASVHQRIARPLWLGRQIKGRHTEPQAIVERISQRRELDAP